MNWNGWAISIATFLPLVGAIAIALVPGSRDRLARGLGIAVTGVAMIVAIAIIRCFTSSLTLWFAVSP